ncbi:OsmC family protein [Vagococcus sp. DIV0080]|uniref:OsmC family protein n=1 Tax=Candidatus Vagococcus giribetii TaxID=2230876 RepID=A0ABS3HTU2_9ENTE|nr:OsmC family protein [Vagococcus sp. DIV0080]MBO0476241.1 OsmC family protein [Vagococcus sp. DIV0080]
MTMDKLQLVQGKEGMELPVESGNWVLLREKGYSPVQSMVAAVGACGAYVYQSILESSRIDYTFDRVEIVYERDEAIKSEPVKKIELQFFVSVADDKQERATRGLKLISKHCPVIQSLNPAIEVIETVVFN